MSNNSGKHKILDIIATITIFQYGQNNSTVLCVVTDIHFRHFTVLYLLSVFIINSNVSNNPGSRHQTLDLTVIYDYILRSISMTRRCITTSIFSLEGRHVATPVNTQVD